MLKELSTAYNYEQAKWGECTDPTFVQIETAIVELINTKGYLNNRSLFGFEETILPAFQL